MSQEPLHPSTDSAPPEPSVSFLRQMMQLVLIPAAIVVICLVVALIFGKLASSRESIDSHLLTLRESSGARELPLGLKSPRDSARWRAINSIAAMVPNIQDPAKRRAVSDELIAILKEAGQQGDAKMQRQLIVAIGLLGQPEGLPTILVYADSQQLMVRKGVVFALRSWHDPVEARVAIPNLLQLADDADPQVATLAVSCLGYVGQPGDQAVMARLREVVADGRRARREVSWNAAAALAKFGDPLGVRIVADVLLDREALSKLPEDVDSGGQNTTMSVSSQNKIMMRSLEVAAKLPDPEIWRKIQALADHDPNLAIRTAAKKLVLKR